MDYTVGDGYRAGCTNTTGEVGLRERQNRGSCVVGTQSLEVNTTDVQLVQGDREGVLRGRGYLRYQSLTSNELNAVVVVQDKVVDRVGYVVGGVVYFVREGDSRLDSTGGTGGLTDNSSSCSQSARYAAQRSSDTKDCVGVEGTKEWGRTFSVGT